MRDPPLTASPEQHAWQEIDGRTAFNVNSDSFEPAVTKGLNSATSYLRRLSAAAIRSIAARLRSTSVSVVAHEDTLMRIAV